MRATKGYERVKIKAVKRENEIMKADTLKNMTARELESIAFVCVLDSARGIYIGQAIGEKYATLIDPVSLDILQNPNNEYYKETWDEVVTDIDFIGNDGHRYTLYTGECGDVFEVDQTLIDNWEHFTGKDFWEDTRVNSKTTPYIRGEQ